MPRMKTYYEHTKDIKGAGRVKFGGEALSESDIDPKTGKKKKKKKQVSPRDMDQSVKTPQTGVQTPQSSTEQATALEG